MLKDSGKQRLDSEPNNGAFYEACLSALRKTEHGFYAYLEFYEHIYSLLTQPDSVLWLKEAVAFRDVLYLS